MTEQNVKAPGPLLKDYIVTAPVVVSELQFIIPGQQKEYLFKKKFNSQLNKFSVSILLPSSGEYFHFKTLVKKLDFFS